MSPIDTLTGEESAGIGSPESIMIVISNLNSAPTFTLPKYVYVHNVRLHVTTAFDAGITLKVGNTADDDAYITGTSVDSTGVKSPTLGAGIGYDSTPRSGTLTLSGAVTQGRALVIIEFYRSPRIN